MEMNNDEIMEIIQIILYFLIFLAVLVLPVFVLRWIFRIDTIVLKLGFILDNAKEINKTVREMLELQHDSQVLLDAIENKLNDPPPKT